MGARKKQTTGGRGLPALMALDGRERDGFGAWISRYLEWMAIHNYSKHTAVARESVLVTFVWWCRARGIDKPRDVTKPILERYQKHLFEHRTRTDRPLCFASQATNLSALRVFFSWLARQNALLWNPASELELPRVPDRLPRDVLSIAEVEAVMAQIDLTTPFGVRDRAMMETLYSTGIRRNELLALTVTDLDSERGTLLIREGKGGKDRMVPIGSRAVQWIDKYIDQARRDFVVDPKETTLFLSHRGTPLDANAISKRVREYVEAAQIGKVGSCHLFRHTMATLMLEAGADVRFIQQMLGHSSLDTTEIYTRVSIRMLKAVHEATHPGRLAMAKQGEPPTDKSGGDTRELFSSLAAEVDDGELD